jgi:Na+-transporting NADH:ubiquinone oxidoreductase subunit NqrB
VSDLNYKLQTNIIFVVERYLLLTKFKLQILVRLLKFLNFMNARAQQLFTQSLFLIIGILIFNAPIELQDIFIVLSASLITQWVFTKYFKLEFNPLSSLISGMSILLLIRSDSLWILAFAAFLAILSKFTLRLNNKHIFNPSNFSICLLLSLKLVWIQPSQWGYFPLFVLFAVALGHKITKKVSRMDITWSYLIFFSCLLFGRSFYLGDPLEIPLHQLQSGGLYIFSFYMISDPVSTPNHPTARILFSLILALLTYYFKFFHFLHEAPFYALFITSLFTFVFDKIFIGKVFNWNYNFRKTATE